MRKPNYYKLTDGTKIVYFDVIKFTEELTHFNRLITWNCLKVGKHTITRLLARILYASENYHNDVQLISDYVRIEKMNDDKYYMILFIEEPNYSLIYEFDSEEIEEIEDLYKNDILSYIIKELTTNIQFTKDELKYVANVFREISENFDCEYIDFIEEETLQDMKFMINKIHDVNKYGLINKICFDVIYSAFQMDKFICCDSKIEELKLAIEDNIYISLLEKIVFNILMGNQK